MEKRPGGRRVIFMRHKGGNDQDYGRGGRVELLGGQPQQPTSAANSARQPRKMQEALKRLA